jgi:hypothetical protein
MHSPKTLINTLSSYRNNGLLNLTDDVSIFFQEVSNTDLAIAEEFEISKVLSSDSNIGIGPAIKTLMENVRYDNVLFLEEDWVIDYHAPEYVKIIVESSLEMVEEGKVDFCRLRSNNNPGAPLYTLQFKKDPMSSPEHLIEQVHTYGAVLAFNYPNIVQFDHDGFIITDSFYGNYSNNPFLCKKQFWLENIAPLDRGGISLEGEIRKTWREAGHKVGYNVPGLFTHYRIDR